jgi:hypothetical protein
MMADGPVQNEQGKAAKPIRSLFLILLLYWIVSGLLVSSFVLYLDITTELNGPTSNGELCRLTAEIGFGFRTIDGSICFVRFEYVAFILMAFPLTIAFWQALFASVVLIPVVAYRWFSGRTADGGKRDHARVEVLFSPLAIASTLHVIGVFVISGVAAMTVQMPIYNPERQDWLFDAMRQMPPSSVFGGFGWGFLLLPVPVFLLIGYFRNRRWRTIARA